MNNRGIFHPDFFYHARPVVESAMIAKITIWEPTGAVPEWLGGNEMSADPWRLVWVGFGRVQPNKDWRARPKEVGGEMDAVHAIRVQIPIGKNLLGAVTGGREPFGAGDFGDDGFGGVIEGYEIIEYGPDPLFAKDFAIRVDNMPVIGTESMESKQLIVRNALISSNAWVHNLLCDIGTK